MNTSKIILYLTIVLLFNPVYCSKAQSITKNNFINSISSKIVPSERVKELASGIYRSLNERYLKVLVKEFEDNYYYKIIDSVSLFVKKQLNNYDLEKLEVFDEIINLWYSNNSRYHKKMQIEADRVMHEEMERTNQPVVWRTYAELNVDEKRILSKIELLGIMGYYKNVDEIINTLGKKIIISELIMNLTENKYSNEQIENELSSVQFRTNVDQIWEDARKNISAWCQIFFKNSLLIVDQYKENEINILTIFYLGQYGEELRKLNYEINNKAYSMLVEKIVK